MTHTKSNTVGTVEAADYLELTRGRVTQFIKDGRLPAVMINGRHRILRTHLEAFSRDRDFLKKPPTVISITYGDERPTIKADDELVLGESLDLGGLWPRSAVLNDDEIRTLCDADAGGHMIYPFEQAQVRHHTRSMQEPACPWDAGVNGALEKVISYGTSSFGYDARLGSEVKVFTEQTDGDDLDIDPSDMTRMVLSTSLNIHAHPRDPHSGRSFVRLPPHASALAHTVERFKIPRDVIAICLGKSTYARSGVLVNVTPLEPGWEGVVTLEIVNTTPRPVRLWVGEGICQFVFLTGNPPSTSYADRNGKYQGQCGITLPRA
jgi:dCTP deaminase